ncbi:type IVa pilus pseudopilin TppA [Aeromonas eucrenophila]|uniref:Type IVa pilus pseudopilin TppA n=1 Tax=Aeromonas eucrenophila TaxID=649 RepID=A0ABW0YAF9_9GAMM|nr:type IVa pilus pseudopilin TppA [Aeromonas eucrenophila]
MIGLYRGFSLIELMIVVVIVAILGAIAYPSYQRYLLTSHRVEAKKMLLDAANRQETYYMDFNRYTSSAVALNVATHSDSNYYNLVISAGTNTFTLSATASGAQGFDRDCVTFSVDQNGARTATRFGNTANNACWD